MRNFFHFVEAVPLGAQSAKQRNTASGLVRTTGFAGYVVATMALSGCVSKPLAYEGPGRTIPKPKAALLSKQPAPKCLYEEPAVAPTEPSSTPAEPADVPASEAEREATKRRERERDCFQAAEQRVREKLTRLQTQVQATVQAIDNLNCVRPAAACRLTGHSATR